VFLKSRYIIEIHRNERCEAVSSRECIHRKSVSQSGGGYVHSVILSSQEKYSELFVDFVSHYNKHNIH